MRAWMDAESGIGPVHVSLWATISSCGFFQDPATSASLHVPQASYGACSQSRNHDVAPPLSEHLHLRTATTVADSMHAELGFWPAAQTRTTVMIKTSLGTCARGHSHTLACGLPYIGGWPSSAALPSSTTADLPQQCHQCTFATCSCTSLDHHTWCKYTCHLLAISSSHTTTHLRTTRYAVGLSCRCQTQHP